MAKRTTKVEATKTASAGPDLLDVALGMMAEQRWRGLDTAELARRAGVGLAEAHGFASGRAALLRRLAARLDQAMLAVPPEDLEGLSPRERLFELIMRRLEAMRAWKPAVEALVRARDPGLALAAARQLDSMSRILIAVGGTGLGGLRALAAGKLLKLLYGQVLRTWLRDDSPDSATTLAELDRRLGQAEKLAGWLARPCRRRPSPTEAVAAAPAG